jgi:autoinducer 2-degrading protein
MNTTLVRVRVKPEHVAEFIEATLANARGSVQEAGNVRFDVLQSKEDPSRFILYEVFTDDAAAAAHKNTPHYLIWKNTVADWMAEPRQGIAYSLLFPVAGNP